MDPAIVVPRKQYLGKRVCCVKNCKSRHKFFAKKLCFHRFAKPNETVIHRINQFGEIEKVDRWKAWKITLDVENVDPGSRVCSLHFTKEDYMVYLTTGCKKKSLKRTAVPSVSVPNDFFKLRRINHSDILFSDAKTANQENNEFIEYIEYIEIKEKIEYEIINDEPLDEEWVAQPDQMLVLKDEPLNEVWIAQPDQMLLSKDEPLNEVWIAQPDQILVSKDEPLDEPRVDEPLEKMLVDSNANLPVIESTFSLTSQEEYSSTKSTVTNRVKTFQDTGVQVQSSCMVPTFMDFITNNSELNTITDILTLIALNIIVKIVREETQDKYENVSCQLKTKERIILTCTKLKHGLPFAFLAIMFKNTYGKMTQECCRNVFRDMVKILYRCFLKAPGQDVFSSTFNQNCLNLVKYQYMLNKYEDT